MESPGLVIFPFKEGEVKVVVRERTDQGGRIQGCPGGSPEFNRLSRCRSSPLGQLVAIHIVFPAMTFSLVVQMEIVYLDSGEDTHHSERQNHPLDIDRVPLAFLSLPVRMVEKTGVGCLSQMLRIQSVITNNKKPFLELSSEILHSCI